MKGKKLNKNGRETTGTPSKSKKYKSLKRGWKTFFQRIFWFFFDLPNTKKSSAKKRTTKRKVSSVKRENSKKIISLKQRQTKSKKAIKKVA